MVGRLLCVAVALGQGPALWGRQRTVLQGQVPVSDAALVLLVVHLELAVAAHDLAVEGVLDTVLDSHDNGLVHLVADDDAFADLAGRALVCGCGLVAHAAPPSFSVPDSTARKSTRLNSRH